MSIRLIMSRVIVLQDPDDEEDDFEDDDDLNDDEDDEDSDDEENDEPETWQVLTSARDLPTLATV